MSGKKLISMAEFKKITKLSPGDILKMLSHGELPVVVTDLRVVMIDTSELDVELIANRTREDLLSTENQALLEEVVTAEVSKVLDHIIDEALNLVLQWQAQGSPK